MKKVSGTGTTTVYVFSGSADIAEYDNGAVPTSPSREYIYSGEQLVATLTPAQGGGTTAIYHHADHLSTRVTTDASGNKVGEQGHYPYGEQWYTWNTATKFFFTTYERDGESGNDYALARFYINRFGRFCSMDPVGGDPSDPQSWNRYAYARNDPINLVDPSGKNWIEILFNILFMIVQLFSGGPAVQIIFGHVNPLDEYANLPLYFPPPTLFHHENGQQKQGPIEPPAPSKSRGRIECDPRIWAGIRQAQKKQQGWNQMENGRLGISEADFPALPTADGGYTPGDIQRQVGGGVSRDAVGNEAADFHTHSGTTIRDGYPSTPRNPGNDGVHSDTATAVKSGKDVYVIAYKGLSKAAASGPRNPEYGKDNNPYIVEGNGIDDWFPKLQKDCASKPK